jgi:predicted anti-sigma-YlaC factor YlaD
VKCEQWFDAISALADGEDPGVDERLLETHLAGCPTCRGRREQFDQLRRVSRVESARPMADLSGRIVKAAALADRTARWVGVRVLLLAIGLYVIGMALSDLFPHNGPGETMHATRHLGAFSLAYGVVLLVVVVRPARARTVLPVGVTLAIALVITAAVDIAEGRIPLSTETLHLPELVSVFLVWLLAVPALYGTGPSLRRNARPPTSLRLVGQQGDEGSEASTDAG